ncbi:hypothetical protein M407DRAFT_236390 [Tulasnella calospora MUT 4182]|uniref:5'-deoxynucleotidase n=1 Tax=Tulasnella calospora MUT 4182 TaxID=1051891 RepID=A0A0C3KWQ2_9AGAM|nr:hypothetical protein M407DRAFT_236390 [Tulasnella calospora MUT 4182]
MEATPTSSSSPSVSGPASKRIVPPYVPSGDEGKDRLYFFHLLERLKTQKRTGWVDNGIGNPESISDHMHRMAVLALCSSDKSLDIGKCVLLAVVHDLAEAQVGDIAPSDGISKQDKRRLEAAAMDNIINDMLGGGTAAQRIRALWDEYEAQETAEAKFVKDLDLFEMALQATEYEKESQGQKLLGPFLESSIPRLRHPEAQSWGNDLTAERNQFWIDRTTKNPEST